MFDEKPNSGVGSMVGEVDFRALQERVLGYALKMGFFESIEKVDSQEIFDFLITLLEHGLIPKRQPFNIDEVMHSHETMFLDRYFFERGHRGTKTIAELYTESEDAKKDFESADFQKLKEDVRKLKTPIWSAFQVTGKREKDEYNVKPIDGEENFLVHDKSTFTRVNVGNWFGGKLYRFGSKCYISGYLVPIPERRIERYYKTRSLSKSLEKEFDEFIETKSNLSKKSIKKYERMFPLFLDYVKEKGYSKFSQVTKLNVDTWIKWIRRRFLYVSRSEEDDHRAAIKQFLRYLWAKRLSPTTPSQSP